MVVASNSYSEGVSKYLALYIGIGGCHFRGAGGALQVVSYWRKERVETLLGIRRRSTCNANLDRHSFSFLAYYMTVSLTLTRS